MTPGVPYEFWFVIDHADMSFSLHIREGSQFPETTPLYTKAHYRKPIAGSLDYFVVNVRGGAVDDQETARASVFIDDLKVVKSSQISATKEHDWILVNDFEDIGMGDCTVARESWDPALGMETVSRYFLVACALHGNGEIGQASRILDILTRYLDIHGDPETTEYYLARMRIHALRGEGGRSLDALRSLVNNNKMGGYWKGMLDGYAFNGLEERIRMARLLTAWEKELSRQRENIQKMGAVSVFTPLTGDPLVSEMGNYYGASCGDLDQDGFLDLAVAARLPDDSSGNIHLYRNLDCRSFSRITE